MSLESNNMYMNGFEHHGIMQKKKGMKENKIDERKWQSFSSYFLLIRLRVSLCLPFRLYENLTPRKLNSLQIK